MAGRAPWIVLAVVAVGLGVAVAADSGAPAPPVGAAASHETPAAAAGKVCGTGSLRGPAKPPAGAVEVPAGDNSDVDFARPGTTYWLAPGTHTLGDDEFAQIGPADDTTFVGAPGAVLDGRGVNRYAFGGNAAGVTIRHLTVRNFAAPRDEGVVNHDSGNRWRIEHNTFTRNKGAAMMAGSGQRIVGNCVAHNGQYGLNAYQAGNQLTGLLVEGNEFTGNNTDDWEAKVDGCGCTGAMKFWSVDGADIRGNWIHRNHGPGIWADTNNNDFLIEDNLIEANDAQAIFYEISYNATIRKNVLRRNTWREGRDFADQDDWFPVGTVYLSEAGGEPRVQARTSVLEVTGNVFDNNWGGVVGWENSDRFCGTNTTSECTLLVGEDEGDRCTGSAIEREPWYDDCRWKTQRLRIHDNTFILDADKVDDGCEPRFCAVHALVANVGTWPEWSPYHGRRVQQAITFRQDNRWYDNRYRGPWQWVGYEPGRYLTFDKWRAAPYRQDPGSS